VDLRDSPSANHGQGGAIIAAALPVCRLGGLLYVTSTDGLALSGRRPEDALANFGAVTQYNPSSNEMVHCPTSIFSPRSRSPHSSRVCGCVCVCVYGCGSQALRVLAGTAYLQGACRGLQVTPLFSLFAHHGPVYRVMLRVRKLKGSRAALLDDVGFLGYCRRCGESTPVPWRDLSNGSVCACAACGPSTTAEAEQGEWSMSGPMWLGPLHEQAMVGEMSEQASAMGWFDHSSVATSGAATADAGQATARWRAKQGLQGAWWTAAGEAIRGERV
jgi:tRNA (guanine26-N2/guanine27-N2)-dimethyltransferase